jgi:DNA repair protein RecO
VDLGEGARFEVKGNMERTNLLVLRKTQYKETSIIVAGLSAEYGRLDIVVKGAKKLSSKNFPTVDLFREIDIEVNHKKKGLYSVYSTDLVANHDNIASFHTNYMQACNICSFALRNSQPGIPSPELYAALKNIFYTLTLQEAKIPYPVLIKLVYLDEHGFLPEIPDNEKEKAHLLEKLINAGMGKNALPEISSEYWEQLNNWVDALCQFHELHS